MLRQLPNEVQLVDAKVHPIFKDEMYLQVLKTLSYI